MIVDYEHQDDAGGEKLRITTAQIDAETNVATLLRWSDAMDVRAGDITSQIEAHVISGISDDDWLISARDALGFFKMGLRRVARRLEKLGHGAGERDQIARIQATNLSLKSALVKAKRDTSLAAAAKEVLSDEIYGALSKRADELMGSPQDLELAA